MSGSSTNTTDTSSKGGKSRGAPRHTYTPLPAITPSILSKRSTGINTSQPSQHLPTIWGGVGTLGTLGTLGTTCKVWKIGVLTHFRTLSTSSRCSTLENWQCLAA